MVLLYRNAIAPWDNLVMGDVTTYVLSGLKSIENWSDAESMFVTMLLAQVCWRSTRPSSPTPASSWRPAWWWASSSTSSPPTPSPAGGIQYTVHSTHYTSIICHYALSVVHSWCGSWASSPEVQSFVGRMRVAQLAWPLVTCSVQQIMFGTF